MSTHACDRCGALDLPCCRMVDSQRDKLAVVRIENHALQRGLTKLETAPTVERVRELVQKIRGELAARGLS